MIPLAHGRDGLCSGVALSDSGASTTLNENDITNAVYFSNYSTSAATVALGYGAAPSVAFGEGPTIPPNGQLVIRTGRPPTHFFAIGPTGASGAVNACPVRVG